MADDEDAYDPTQYSIHGPKLPKGAQMLCRLSLPYGTSETYSIEGGESWWSLWSTAHDYDTGRPMHLYLGGCDGPMPLREAAIELLATSWKVMARRGDDIQQPCIDELGLLAAEDVDA